MSDRPISNRDPAYLDACARKLDASLRPVLDAIYARLGLTREEVLALPHPAAVPISARPVETQAAQKRAQKAKRRGKAKTAE